MKDSIAITAWSVLPLIATCISVQRNGWLALIFGGITAIALAAASLSRSTKRADDAIAAALLLMLAIPFAVQIVHRLTAGQTSHPLRVADSPAGFIAGTIFDSLLAVPPAVFASGVWRRRRRELQQSRLSRECASLDRQEEQALAEAGYAADVDWSEPLNEIIEP